MKRAGAGDRSGWAEKYPPLLGLGVVLFLAIAVLPSALTLPQSNPSTTLEYAPVSDSKNAPPGGNFSSLGLGSTSGLSQPGPGGSVGGGLQGAGKTPSDKHCVGKPPRQSEDPLSPPCVAYFRGDNFGATYQGVTRQEVRILVVMDSPGQQCATSKGCERWTNNTYVDAQDPPADDDPIFTRSIKLWQRYFNLRYQTYNRFVHFYIWYGSASLPEDRRAEAADNLQRIHPFAVYEHQGTYTQDYLEAMASKGVMSFGPTGFFSLPGYDEAFYRQHPGLLWSYNPTVQYRAHNFATYVCTQVVPFNASFSGNPGENDNPRRLGLLWADVPGNPMLKTYADIVRRDVNACGGNFVDDKSLNYWCSDFGCSANARATQNMASFQSNNVSTIIWAGGPDANSGRAASKIGYRPEIILGGDGANETTATGQFQDQDFWSRVFAFTTYTRVSPFENSPCWQAATEVDPNANRQDIRNFACKMYDGLRQIFIGIQVAGPRLTPARMEDGFRAIPGHPSSDPRAPACFYGSNDYTCVKDATIQWWDPSGKDPESTVPGCYRLVEAGKRYLPGTWPKADVPTYRKSTDPCNPEDITN